MNDQLKVPESVAALIEDKKLAMQFEQEEEERNRLAKRNETIEAGRVKLRSKVAELLTGLPEWLRQYDVTEISFSDDDLVNVGDGYNKLDTLWLQFNIPGLAPIQYRSKSSDWRSASFFWDYYEYGPNKPDMGFTNGSYWRSDLEYTLVEAEYAMGEFNKRLEEYAQKIEADKVRAEQELQNEEKSHQARKHKQNDAEAEERELFNIFKDDPVAINLLKAFLMISQERSMFESQISDANETVYSVEARWSRRAEDLRRQADDAQRRAEDEKYRLQSDLDDAENKLKKAQRGW